MTTPNASQKPVLVIGATGKTGRRVADQLEGLGRPVRRASRSATVRFDWEDDSTWGPALDGAGAAYITYVPDLSVPQAEGHIRAFVAAAERAGLERLVLLVSRGMEGVQVSCEAAVLKSSMQGTVIRATWFAQNFSEGVFLDPVQGGMLALPVGEVREPFIDLDDLAAVAVKALTEDGHDGQTYELTGPELIGFEEATRMIANAAGRPVGFVSIPADAFREELAKVAGPEEADLVTEIVTTTLDGRNERLTDDVERVLGRKPKRFADYCVQAAASGAWEVAR